MPDLVLIGAGGAVGLVLVTVFALVVWSIAVQWATPRATERALRFLSSPTQQALGTLLCALPAELTEKLDAALSDARAAGPLRPPAGGRSDEDDQDAALRWFDRLGQARLDRARQGDVGRGGAEGEARERGRQGATEALGREAQREREGAQGSP